MWRHSPKTDIFVHRLNFVTEMCGVSCEVRTEQFALFIGTAHSQYRLLYLGVKLRKMTISFVMPVCPHRTSRLPLDGFSWNLIFEYFTKICRKNQFLLKSDKNNGHFTWKPVNIYGNISLSSSYKVRNVPDKSCRVNKKIQWSFIEIVPFIGWRGKLSQNRAGHRWQYGASAFHAGCLSPNII